MRTNEDASTEVHTPAQSEPAPVERSRIGDLIRNLRLAAGLTQEELAEKTELSVRSIRNVERSAVQRPRGDTVRRLGIALGLDRPGQAELIAGTLPRSRTPTQARTPAGDDPLYVTPELRGLLHELASQTAADTVLVVFCRPGGEIHCVGLRERCNDIADATE